MSLATRIAVRDSYEDLHFPLAGLDVSMAFDRQPARQTAAGYARTCPVGTNVRAYDPTTGRARGGSRSGLARYIDATVNGANLIQALDVVVGSGYSPPGGTSQSSLSGRVVTLFVVSAGLPFITDVGGTAWTAVTNDTGLTVPFATTGIIRSTSFNQRLYLTSGTYKYSYDPSDNKLETWAASSGTFPGNSAGTEYARILGTWRGRLVHTAVEDDPHNWFMSAVDDATNYNYSPDSISETQAVAGNNSTLGKIGDVVTAFIPYSDDTAFFGCDHEIWQMSGDPMDGGSLDNLSRSVGMAFGEAWCEDDRETIYFFGNRGGVFTLRPGEKPVRISQAVDELLRVVNTGTNGIRLLWDDEAKEVKIFITPTAAAGAATHYVYETRTGAWWKKTFADNNYNPLVCCTLDGNAAADRVSLIGSWDGYVRSLALTATLDDQKDVLSEVWIGPLLSPTFDDMILHEMEAVLGTSSGSVSYAVHVGATAEAALSSTAVSSGTFVAGRNPSKAVRRSGKAVFIKLSGTTSWQFEAIRARVSTRGKVRARSKV